MVGTLPPLKRWQQKPAVSSRFWCFRYVANEATTSRVQPWLAICSHDGYASCVAYCYVPSPNKPMDDLDPGSLPCGQAIQPHQQGLVLESRDNGSVASHVDGGKAIKAASEKRTCGPLLLKKNIRPRPDRRWNLNLVSLAQMPDAMRWSNGRSFDFHHWLRNLCFFSELLKYSC